MTTAHATPSRARVVLGPLAASVAVGVLLVAAGGLLTGAPGAVGALVGALMTTLVFAFGATVVGVVARVMPSASLLVALLTYSLQVVVVAAVYVGLSRGGALEGPVSGPWVSAAVIGCTLAWTVTLITVTMRARVPVYDLPPPPPEASVR